MTGNKFSQGETVYFNSKSDPSVSGVYTIDSVEYESNGLLMSDNTAYEGWVYWVKEFEQPLVETSLRKYQNG